MRAFQLVIAGMLAVGSAAFAQQKTPPGAPLDLLDSEIGRLGGKTDPAVPVSDAELKKQFAELEERLDRMEEQLTQKSDAIEQLEDENEKLRQALRLRFGGHGEGLPPVPIANRELIESVLRESAPFPERKESANPSDATEEYTVVSEWGRSPEIAASLPGSVSSLIGLALAVPSGMTEAAIKQLGQDLRRNYQNYDNINIEVFDDVEAARRFANEGKTDAGHRVMSISKFKHSGRDSMVMYRNGKSVNVP